MYTFDSVVRYSEVDENGLLTVPALINYLQDCTYFQAECLGRGVAYAAAARRCWMLAAWEVEILKMPRFGDAISISTWATQFKGLFATRNFTVRVPGERGERGWLYTEGETLVRADSLWFMYDGAAGRPIRAPKEETDPYLPDIERDGRLDMPPIQRRIPVEGPGEAATPVVVTAAHIDTNHHVNNAQYVSLALGALPEGSSARVRFLDVQYCEAAHLGDTIYPRVHTVASGAGGEGDECGHTVTLDDASGNPYAVVRVRWDKRDGGFCLPPTH